jgi:hypothetical protein
MIITEKKEIASKKEQEAENEAAEVRMAAT